ncbi:MAG: hypothetical protein R3249_10550 [Nitriliruptorales bacterium]|nr:hypothetical protein [Nitriliruptorales bacterium]
MNGHERVYGVLISLYPREHREEFGPDMVQLFRDRLRDEGGGMRSALVWSDIGSDLVKTAFMERLEMTTMDNLKQTWWLVTAPIVAAAVVIFGFGNMVTDDGGEFWMRALFFGITVAFALVVVVGLVLRRRHKAVGSLIIGLAVLPGSVLTALFWFPPVALVGLLCLVTAIKALSDYAALRRATPETVTV